MKKYQKKKKNSRPVAFRRTSLGEKLWAGNFNGPSTITTIIIISNLLLLKFWEMIIR